MMSNSVALVCRRACFRRVSGKSARGSADFKLRRTFRTLSHVPEERFSGMRGSKVLE